MFTLSYSNFLSGYLYTNCESNVESFINQDGIVPRSLGIEFIEPTSKVMISVGYEEDTEPNTGFGLNLVKLGLVTDLEVTQEKMGIEASKLNGIICHEFFVDENQEFFSLFLTSN